MVPASETAVCSNISQVCADATLVFPLMVAQTFAKAEHLKNGGGKKGFVYNKSYTTTEHDLERKKLGDPDAVEELHK